MSVFFAYFMSFNSMTKINTYHCKRRIAECGSIIRAGPNRPCLDRFF